MGEITQGTVTLLHTRFTEQRTAGPGNLYLPPNEMLPPGAQTATAEREAAGKLRGAPVDPA